MPIRHDVLMDNVRALALRVGLAMTALVLLSACTSDGNADLTSLQAPVESTTEPVTTSSVQTITAFSWGTGWCGGWYACSASAEVDGPTIGVTSEGHPGVQITAQLNKYGLRGMSRLANDILKTNPRRESGGPGVIIDGTTFFLTIQEEGSGPWSGSWGFQKKDSPFHAAYDRTQRLVARMVRCEADPWLTLPDPCTPVREQ